MSAPATAPHNPPTGRRNEDGRLEGLDWGDPATRAWAQAKQARHDYDTRQAQRKARRKAKKRKRALAKITKRANHG